MITNDFQAVRGPLLNPRPDGRVEFLPDGVLLGDAAGRLLFVGDWARSASPVSVRRAAGILVPPFLDCHTHIPQYPIRGHFTDGLPDDLRAGRLLAGLERNVFPEEGRYGDAGYAARVVREFAKATLAQGVVGGAAYTTVHSAAAAAALGGLPETWAAGLVLMDQNCPAYLRTDLATWARDYRALASRFGPRVIVTDRFAVTGSPPLRRQAVDLAAKLGLRMQTHLNEQRAEKALVETVLYPDRDSYTDVYARDGLLDRAPLLAHCIQMRPEEWDLLERPGVAVAHCPTSNTLLGSGTMPLDEVTRRGLPYALCTDVGASPTPSLLAEMAQFLKVHRGRAESATPSEALWRATLAPARILGLDGAFGSFEAGKPMSFCEIAWSGADLTGRTADWVIEHELLGAPSVAGLEGDLDALASRGLEHGAELARLTEDVRATARRLEGRVLRVTLAGQQVWQNAGAAPGD